MTIRRRPQRARRLLALVLSAVTVWLAYSTATVQNVQAFAAALSQQTELTLSLLRLQLGDSGGESMIPTAASFVLACSPLLSPLRKTDLSRQGGEEQDEAPTGEEIPPETILSEQPKETEPPFVIEDNGVAERTLVPTSAYGYIVTGQVYVDNRSDRTVPQSLFSEDYAAAFADTDAPQVLIVHTHGSEAYTMPPGQEYTATGDCRTTDASCSVIRVGEEVASVLEAAGITVLHDKTLHDHPRYSGAYERSLATVERYLERYPSIVLVLDIHRDAISDGEGNPYKLVSSIGGMNAAQMCFVVGTDGGGASHPNWQENLKLAADLQSTLCSRYPTLMRPITVRNSRYNQHASVGALLVEVGSAGNSLQEAILSAGLLGEAIVQTMCVKTDPAQQVGG